MLRNLALIIALALAVRIFQIFTAQLCSRPLQAEPTEEVRIAQLLAAGHGFVTPFYDTVNQPLSPSAHSPPAYVYFLAALIRLGKFVHGDAMLPYRVAIFTGAFAGAVAVGFLAVAARNVAGWRGFWIVGCVASIWPTLVTLSPILWDTAFTILALAIGIFLATLPRRPQRSSPKYDLSMGAFGGIATLMNPIAAPFLAAAIASRFLADRRKLRAYMIVCAAWLLCIAPWTVRNVVAFHRLVPIRHNLGLELWLGNHPGCDGTTQSTERYHPRDNPSERRLVAQLGEGPYMQLKWREAVDLIRSDPSRFAMMTKHRTFLYWFGNVHRPTHFLGQAFPMVRGLNLLKFAINGLFLASAIAGLVFCRQLPGRWALAFGMLILPAPFYITHVAPNYRVYVDPLVCFLAGVLAARIYMRQEMKPRVPLAVGSVAQ